MTKTTPKHADVKPPTLPDKQSIANDSPRFRKDTEAQYKIRGETINHFGEMQDATKDVIKHMDDLVVDLGKLMNKIELMCKKIFTENELLPKPAKKSTLSIKRADAFKEPSPNNTERGNVIRKPLNSATENREHSVKSLARNFNVIDESENPANRQDLSEKRPTTKPGYRKPSRTGSRVNQSSYVGYSKNHGSHGSIIPGNSRSSTITKKGTSANFLAEQMADGVTKFISTLIGALSMLNGQMKHFHETNDKTMDENRKDNKEAHKNFIEKQRTYYKALENYLNDKNKEFKKESNGNRRSTHNFNPEKEAEKYRADCFEYMMYCYNFSDDFQATVAMQLFKLTSAMKCFTDQVSFNHNRENEAFHNNFDSQIRRLDDQQESLKLKKDEMKQNMIDANSQERPTNEKHYECRIFHIPISKKQKNASTKNFLHNVANVTGSLVNTEKPQEVYLVYNDQYKTLRLYSDRDDKDYESMRKDENDLNNHKTMWGKRIKEMVVTKVEVDPSRALALIVKQQLVVSKQKELIKVTNEAKDAIYDDVVLQFKSNSEKAFWLNILSSHGNKTVSAYALLGKNKDTFFNLNRSIVSFFMLAIDTLESPAVEVIDPNNPDQNQNKSPSPTRNNIRIQTQGIYRVCPRQNDAEDILTYIREENLQFTSSSSSDSSGNMEPPHIQQMINEKHAKMRTSIKEKISTAALAGTIKQVLQKLDPPLIPSEYYYEFVQFLSHKGDSNPQINNFSSNPTIRYSAKETNTNNVNNVSREGSKGDLGIHVNESQIPNPDKYGGVFLGDTNNDSDGDDIKDEQAEQDIRRMVNLLRKLPNINYKTLILLLNHWRKVTEHVDSNKMTSLNMGICIAPSLLRPKENGEDEGINEIMLVRQTGECLDYMIQNSKELTVGILGLSGNFDYDQEYKRWKDSMLTNLK